MVAPLQVAKLAHIPKQNQGGQHFEMVMSGLGRVSATVKAMEMGISSLDRA